MSSSSSELEKILLSRVQFGSRLNSQVSYIPLQVDINSVLWYVQPNKLYDNLYDVFGIASVCVCVQKAGGERKRKWILPFGLDVSVNNH